MILLPAFSLKFISELRFEIFLPDPHHTKAHQLHVVLVEQWYDPGRIADYIN